MQLGLSMLSLGISTSYSVREIPMKGGLNITLHHLHLAEKLHLMMAYFLLSTKSRLSIQGSAQKKNTLQNSMQSDGRRNFQKEPTTKEKSMKKKSFKNTRRNEEILIQSYSSPSPKTSDFTMRWLSTSPQIQHKTYFTQNRNDYIILGRNI